MSKKKILVTDDDPSIGEVFRLILERAGYEINVLSDGNALLENDFELPDMILLDKQLSGLNGLDICRSLKMREGSKSVPLIMISATPDIGILAKDAGADDFLEKPFKMNDLLNIVKKNFKEQH